MNWFKNLFKKRGNLMIEIDDDNEADVIAECYRTGKPVSGSVDDNGKLTIHKDGANES